MRSHRITAVTAVTAAAGIVVSMSQAGADPRCQEIEATIFDQIVDEGCPPPVQVCVVGTVRGKHGFDGTTVFVLGSRGEAPPTAPDQGPVSGTITYTFGDGSTLMALETSIGNVNPDTGTGHAGGTQQFTGGTGRYEDEGGVGKLTRRPHLVGVVADESSHAGTRTETSLRGQMVERSGNSVPGNAQRLREPTTRRHPGAGREPASHDRLAHLLIDLLRQSLFRVQR